MSMLERMNKARLAILASGRGTNAVRLIEASKEGFFPAEVAAVISDVKDAPVLAKAKELGVEALHLEPGPKKTYLVPEVEKEWVRVLKEYRVDYILLAGFMRVLKRAFFESFANRIINIHPSLLPSFRGLDAQSQALDFGVKVSGATVHFVDDSLDSGPIIMQEPVEVREDDTVHTLSKRILEAEHRIYPEAVKLLVEGRLEIKGRKVKILKEEHGR